MPANPQKIKTELELLKKRKQDKLIESTRHLVGPKGKDGRDGKNGREIELHKGEEYIEWKYTDEATWRRLVSLEELKGDKPENGIDYFVRHGRDGRDGRNGMDGISGSDGGGDSLLENSTFTYTDGLVTRIDYVSGQYKTFTYNPDSTVGQLVWHRLTDTVTKDFIYNLDGTLASVNITII